MSVAEQPAVDEAKKPRITEDQLAAAVVVGMHRLVKQSTLYTTENEAQRRQLELTQRAVLAYGRRTGRNPKIYFADNSIFVCGRLLRAGRAIYDAALELGRILKRFGIDEVTIGFDVPVEELKVFQDATAHALRSANASPAGTHYTRIRLKRGQPPGHRLGDDQLTPQEMVVRAYCTSIVVMRRFLEAIADGKQELPIRVRRVAQQLADLGAIESPAFLGTTALYNARHEHAGRAVNSAMMAIGMSRQITDDGRLLARIAMAALLYDVGMSRVAGMGPTGEGRMGMALPRLGEEQYRELPGAAAAVTTALGGLGDASVTHTVLVYEAIWHNYKRQIGVPYEGLRPVTMEARIVAIARRFIELLADQEDERTADQAVSQLLREANDQADTTAVRLLMCALGLFPAGTLVELSNNQIAQVVQVSESPLYFSQPTVRPVIDAAGGSLGQTRDIDLASDKKLRIVRIVATGDDSKVGGDVQRRPPKPAPEARPAHKPKPAAAGAAGMPGMLAPGMMGRQRAPTAHDAELDKAFDEEFASRVIEPDDAMDVELDAEFAGEGSFEPIGALVVSDAPGAALVDQYLYGGEGDQGGAGGYEPLGAPQADEAEHAVPLAAHAYPGEDAYAEDAYAEDAYAEDAYAEQGALPEQYGEHDQGQAYDAGYAAQPYPAQAYAQPGLEEQLYPGQQPYSEPQPYAEPQPYSEPQPYRQAQRHAQQAPAPGAGSWQGVDELDEVFADEGDDSEELSDEPTAPIDDRPDLARAVVGARDAFDQDVGPVNWSLESARKAATDDEDDVPSMVLQAIVDGRSPEQSDDEMTGVYQGDPSELHRLFFNKRSGRATQARPDRPADSGRLGEPGHDRAALPRASRGTPRGAAEPGRRPGASNTPTGVFAPSNAALQHARARAQAGPARESGPGDRGPLAMPPQRRDRSGPLAMGPERAAERAPARGPIALGPEQHDAQAEQDAEGGEVAEAPRRLSRTHEWLQRKLTGSRPTSQGNLAKTPFVHLLVYLLDRKLTGTLMLVAEQAMTHFIYFQEGVPSKVRTSGGVAPLDRVLIEMGLLDEATLQQSVETVSERGELHGRYLVQKGLLDVATITAALQWQLVRKIGYMLKLPPTTRYAYYDGVNMLDDYGGPQLTPAEPLALIMTGVRVLGQTPLIDPTLARLGQTPLRIRREADFRRLHLKEPERRIVDLLRARPMTLPDLLTKQVAPGRIPQHTIYALVITRCLNVGADQKPSVGFSTAPIDMLWNPATMGQAAQAKDGQADEANVTQPGARRGTASTRGQVPRRQGATGRGAIPRHGTSSARGQPLPRRGTSSARGEPLPRRGTSSTGQPLPRRGTQSNRGEPVAPGGAPPAAASGPGAFGPGATQVITGQGLAAPGVSPVQGHAVAGQGLGGRGATPRGVVSSASPFAARATPAAPLPAAPMPAAPMPAAQAPAAQARSAPTSAARREAPPRAPQSSPHAAEGGGSGLTREQIEARASALDDQNFFEMLGVTDQATPEQIQTTYFQLAKTWHPDRLHAGMAELKPKVAMIFARLNEAYQTLSNAEKRREYGDVVKSGGGTARDREMVERVVDSALLFQKGEVMFRKGSYGQAELMVRQAVDADPDQPEYRALLAWIQAHRLGEPPEGKDRSRFYADQIRMLDLVVKQEPDYERALFYRGQLLKRTGHEEKALGDFRRVVELNPRNIDAAREVRLSGLRAKKEQKGIFGRLFTKDKS